VPLFRFIAVNRFKGAVMSQFIQLNEILQIPEEWHTGVPAYWPIKIPKGWPSSMRSISDGELEVLLHDEDRIDITKAMRVMQDMARRRVTIIGVERDGRPAGFVTIFGLSKAITDVFTPVEVDMMWVCKRCAPPTKLLADTAPRCPKNFMHGPMEADSGR
jgi:hypothetical protein